MWTINLLECIIKALGVDAVSVGLNLRSFCIQLDILYDSETEKPCECYERKFPLGMSCFHSDTLYVGNVFH